MNCGQASDVNSNGTNFSAFARIGEAAILTGISSSESGSSGRVCNSSLEELVFFALEQARKKIIPSKQGRYFRLNKWVCDKFLFYLATKAASGRKYKKYFVA